MGGRSPDRIPRLRSLKDTPPGWIRLGVCRGCGRRSALPVAMLLARYGELFPTERALFALRCLECGKRKVEAVTVRLCEPGCPRQRG